ncbi:MAG: amidohydrolase family protein [Bacteroidales bacterium]|nr:amidohydrolase family protein [Bacteroidales bacterium]MBQ7459214.1 amidohydrolase family protein [Bacteroidales bacterium]
MKAIKGKIVTENVIVSGYLMLDGGKIADVTLEKPQCEIEDRSECYLLPGFIDMHIHGVHNFLVDDGPEALAGMCRTLPRYGVTGFLPTVSPSPMGQDSAYLKTLSATSPEGTHILGFHLEGPFLALTGAFNKDAIGGGGADRVNALIAAAKPYKCIFSISPDVDGIFDLIPIMAQDDTPVFMTHTAANVQQAQKAIELGARHCTHFYDVFPCPPVSEPGVRPSGIVEAVLADPRVSVDFILDGVHVDPIAVKMALVAKQSGPGSVCLITDANVGAGFQPGTYTFGNMGDICFDYPGAPARSVKDHTLAGSGLTLDVALRNAVKLLGLDLVAASKLLSYNPAKVLHLEKQKGLLASGYDADFVVLDGNLEVQSTWVSGKEFYKK